MATVNFHADVQQALRRLAAYRDDQVPFATALALTDTAKQTAAHLAEKLPEVFDRPTPFTRRAFGFERASKRALAKGARVFIKPTQAAYLRLQIEGGERTPARRALLLPSGVRLNAYGNLPRGKVKQLLARPDVFSGKVRGVAGVWQRTHKGPKLLIAYEASASYKPRFDFERIATNFARGAFSGNFQSALATAMRTAR